jgi:hypothetical protein
MHQRRRSLPMSSWRQHSSQHHKIVLHLVYLGVLSQSEGFGRHGAGEGRWGREWCSFGHGTWFLNGLSLSMSLCHMVRRKSCKVLKVWPKTRLYCKICIDLQDALHSEICLHWREGNGGSTPSSVAQSCGTFRQGGARRGQEGMLKVYEGLCDPTCPFPGGSVPTLIYVDLCRLYELGFRSEVPTAFIVFAS